MKISVITIFPKLIEQFAEYGLLGQAIKKQLIQIQTISPREFTEDVHKTVDDRPYGGGDGMILLAEPLEKAVQSLSPNSGKVIYLSPQGTPLNDAKVRELAKETAVTFICGRYGGIDQRFLNHYVDEEISIGDYVLSGGEVAACVVIEAVSRMIPGVLGHQASAQEDSFSEGLLEAPSFTRPAEYGSQAVPAILLSGDHAKIKKWRRQVGFLVTLKKRPDLLLRRDYAKTELQEIYRFWQTLTLAEKVSLGLETIEQKDFDLFPALRDWKTRE